MLTGKVPFYGTHEQIQRQQLSGALPLDHLKDVPRTVVDLIKRMLEADPAKRPQSPAGLKEQLNHCIATIDPAKQKQRRRFAYSALVSAVIVFSVLAVFYFLQRKFLSNAAVEVVPEKSIAVYTDYYFRTYCNSNFHGNGYSYSNTYSNGNAYGYSYGDRKSDINTYSDGQSDHGGWNQLRHVLERHGKHSLQRHLPGRQRW